ncbi:MAG: asparagine synthase (glutamine-hydrolyzing), partial [bacterium]|nr:asparagine synthase (glutamine-hydrolyzing) [bacterium]
MCGIAGYVRFAADLGADELREIALRMARAQQHRGPDDEGVWLSPDGRCALAHRRLSVIDTSSAGHQPMESSGARHCISYNGEIYNYREIRSQLETKGHRFRTQSDTEVLLAALDEFGVEAFEQLDGMYGFGRYSNTTGELLLARDPFGEKPLYTLSTPEGFAFASELEALRCVPGFDATVELSALAELLCFQYVDAPRSFYKGTCKLEPGSWLRVSREGHQETRRHFSFRPGHTPDEGRSLDDYADELEDLLVESIRRRLIADVPLGAFLSGGIDSSTIVALITRKLGLPVKTFSIGFRDSPDSEHELAAAIAKHLGTEHRERIVPPTEVQRFAELGGWLDEPNADTSCLPTYLLSQFTREEVTVAVSGDGGDEL